MAITTSKHPRPKTAPVLGGIQKYDLFSLRHDPKVLTLLAKGIPKTSSKVKSLAKNRLFT